MSSDTRRDQIVAVLEQHTIIRHDETDGLVWFSCEDCGSLPDRSVDTHVTDAVLPILHAALTQQAEQIAQAVEKHTLEGDRAWIRDSIAQLVRQGGEYR